MKELELKDILENIEELTTVKEADSTVTITSERLKAEVSFFIPTMEDLAISADPKTKTVSSEGVYKLLTHLIATPITTEWLEAFKVTTNLEVVKFLFTENEAYVIFGILSDSMEDITSIVKKN